MKHKTGKLLTYRELEALYGINRSTAASWVFQKLIPHYRLSKRAPRFLKEDLDAWLDSKRVPTKQGTKSNDEGGDRDE